MNYQKIYNSLIEKRRLYPINKDRSKPFEVEYHHIIPIACNGKKDPKKKQYNHEGTNIVGLTLREHFLAHWLLAKIYDGKFMNAMWNAFSHMCGKYSTANGKTFLRCSSHVYVLAKQNAGKYIRSKLVGRIWMNNGKIEKFILESNAPFGFVKGRLNVNKNRIRNDYTKNTIWINDGQNQKMINKNESIPDGWQRGRIVSWSRKGNCSNLIWVNNGIIQKRVKQSNIPQGFVIGMIS